eukprot:2994194-Prymnesium_polylepis.1
MRRTACRWRQDSRSARRVPRPPRDGRPPAAAQPRRTRCARGRSRWMGAPSPPAASPRPRGSSRAAYEAKGEHQPTVREGTREGTETLGDPRADRVVRA